MCVPQPSRHPVTIIFSSGRRKQWVKWWSLSVFLTSRNCELNLYPWKTANVGTDLQPCYCEGKSRENILLLICKLSKPSLWNDALIVSIHDVPPPPPPHPELRPGLLQGLSGGVQCAPSVGQLRLPPLPALQEQCRPHHVKEGENNAADVLTGLEEWDTSTIVTFSFYCTILTGQRVWLCTPVPGQTQQVSRAGSRWQQGRAWSWYRNPTRQSTYWSSPRSSRRCRLQSVKVQFCSVLWGKQHQVDLLYRVSYQVAAFHTQPGPMRSSADWGSSAHGEETSDGLHLEPPTLELKQRPLAVCRAGWMDNKMLNVNGMSILIGCPSRKWMLWSTSPCLALRLSSQYFIMLWRSWKPSESWKGLWNSRNVTFGALHSQTLHSSDLRGKEAQLALNVLVDVVLLTGKASHPAAKLWLDSLVHAHLLGPSQ